MEFDDAKENIQPLAAGRNASILHASITHTSQELNDQRRELEMLIHDYNGDDPLDPWYNYVRWIEQVFPSGGKESGLSQVLIKCLRRFESEERYYQDRRMIKLFLKFLENHKEPLECFQQLHNAGIGTMVGDFYIAWAYCYNSIGQLRKADEIFRRGIECRAEPLDELKESYQHFSLSVSQRLLYKDDENALQDTNRQLEERRLALSSLHGLRSRKGEVGSVRTGAAIKSIKPGTIQTDSHQAAASTSGNLRVDVLKDENINPNMLTSSSTEINTISNVAEGTKSSSVIRSIVDEARHQENQHEPGPWNKVHDKKNLKKLLRQKVVTHDIGFNIHEDNDEDDHGGEEKSCEDFSYINITDTENNLKKPFKYPPNFVSKNKSQREWVLPITTEVELEKNTFPMYNKCMLYPRSNREFQAEELLGYYFYKKRKIENAYTRRYSTVWSVNDITAPFRMYPNFARRSQPQKLDSMDRFEVSPKVDGMIVPVEQIYDEKAQEEYQQEELMARYLLSLKNQTVMELADMEETMCCSSNNEQVQRRKSLFPTRRSLAIRNILSENMEFEQLKQPEKEASIGNLVKEEANDEVDQNSDVVVVAETQSSSNTVLVAKISETPPISLNDATTSVSANNKLETDEFSFKLPGILTKPSKQKSDINEAPIAAQAIVLPKLPFEIFVEEPVEDVSLSAPTPGVFDAEETCSTQLFNNFLKTQSASTPKLEQKIQKRQFNVLRDVEPSKSTSPATPTTVSNNTSTSPTDSNSALSSAPSHSLSPISPNPDGECTVGLAVECRNINSYTPPLRKQLSTILETSEHATHSAATTKSSESEISEATTANQAQKSHVETNALTSQRVTQEITDQMAQVQLASKISTFIDPIEETTDELEKNKVDNANGTISTKIIEEQKFLNSNSFNEKLNLETAEDIRSASQNNPNTFQKFAIFQDPTETVPNVMLAKTAAIAGNFERMLECNDLTLDQLKVHPVRFQQDKTETLTKFLGTRYFPEDKTETLPKIPEPPQTPMSYELVKPQNSCQTTIVKSIEPMATDDEDLYDFFRKSPAKFPTLTTTTKKINQSQNYTNLQLTPLTKHHCMQETPYERMAANSVASSKNLLSTFMNDFSLPESSKSNQTSFKETSIFFKNCTQKDKNFPNLGNTNKCNTELYDTFVPEFSFIENTQTNNMKNKTLAEFPIIKETQSTQQQQQQQQQQINNDALTQNMNNDKLKSIMDNLQNETLLTNVSVNEETQNQKFIHSQQSSVASKGAVQKIPQLKSSAKKKSDINLCSRSHLLKNSFSTDHSIVKATQLKQHSQMEPLKQQHTFEKFNIKLSNFNLQDSSFLPDFSMTDEINCSKNEKQSKSPNSMKTSQNTKTVAPSQFNASKKEMQSQQLSNYNFPDSYIATFDMTQTKQITNEKSDSIFSDTNEIYIAETQPTAETTPKVDILLKIHNESNLANYSKTFNETLKRTTSLTANKAARTTQSLIPKIVTTKQQKHSLSFPDKFAIKEEEAKINNDIISSCNDNSNNASNKAKSIQNIPIFELNAETETFSNGLNMIQNSTMFSNVARQTIYQTQIQEPSFHIKTEQDSNVIFEFSANQKNKQFQNQNYNNSQLQQNDDDEMSIYYKHTPRTPNLNTHKHTWSNDDDDENLVYIHQEVDLNQTNQLIESICIDPNVNPFNIELMNAFLDHVDFVNFLKNQTNTMFVGNIARLAINSQLRINDVTFKITKLIGEGSYGTIYCATNTKTEKKYALKQEKPPNYWEYYICLEVQDRIKSDEILSSYMNIEYAKIGNNASVLVSSFSPYGSIITVCNKIKKVTNKNVDEYVVMHLACELLEIIDHLHAANIIHADIKADNFLFQKKISYRSKETCLQLIDFGVSIDMRQFKRAQVFTYVHNDNTFKCIEMREKRPWTYQLDLYGLAGVIHVLLFGKYMDVEKKNFWMPKQRMPRYINRTLWERIFRSLLNIRDCSSMPNLQQLRLFIKQEMVEKERFVINKMAEFNQALDS